MDSEEREDMHMTHRKSDMSEKRHARRDMADMATELAALQHMTVSELQRKYRELVGEPSRSRNKDHLRKKVAWRIQELAEGGLSKRAHERLNELAAGLPDGWRRRLQNPTPANQPGKDADAKSKPIGRKRDPRLPAPGSKLERIHKGKLHTVNVLDIGFEYEGEHYSSLSKVAHAITGTPWNGFSFFGLKKQRNETQAAEAEVE